MDIQTMHKIKEKLRNRQRIYGTAIVSTSPHWPRVIAPLGLDFVFIDWEHMALTRAEIMSMCQWYRGIGAAPLVRILSPEPNLASAVLDAGAMGVLVPYVEDAEQVLAVSGAVHFKPLKGKKLQNILQAKEEINPLMAEYLREKNDERFLWINIESKHAVRNLDELLKVPGLDGVLIGPHDLSCSYDLPEMYDHPLFVETVNYIINACRIHEISVGIHFSENTERQQYWMERGANIISHSSDMGLFARALAQDLEVLKKAMGDDLNAGEVDVLI